MWVSHLTLRDFRNYETLDLDLQAGRTLFLGRNGQGKTNIVESIAYLATFSSHRAASDVALVRWGTDAAHVVADLVRDERRWNLDLTVRASGANRIRINGGASQPMRAAAGLTRVVTFAPEDLSIVRGDPAERRRFLDDLLIQRAPRIAALRSDYDKVLRQRTALLKTAVGGPRGGSESLALSLDIWSERLATAGGALMRARLDAVDALAAHLPEQYASLAGGDAGADRHAGIAYAPGSAATAVLADRPVGGCGAAELADVLLQAMHQVRDQELVRGVCLVGPHRDDVRLTLGDQPVKGYASHGESWSVALSLRLSAFAVLCDDAPTAIPILVLDDVFAELDGRRRTRLGRAIGRAEQVLLTAAAGEDVPMAAIDATIDVQAATATPRSAASPAADAAPDPLGEVTS